VTPVTNAPLPPVIPPRPPRRPPAPPPKSLPALAHVDIEWEAYDAALRRIQCYRLPNLSLEIGAVTIYPKDCEGVRSALPAALKRLLAPPAGRDPR
jgi:hypothetical protein